MLHNFRLDPLNLYLIILLVLLGVVIQYTCSLKTIGVVYIDQMVRSPSLPEIVHCEIYCIGSK